MGYLETCKHFHSAKKFVLQQSAAPNAMLSKMIGNAWPKTEAAQLDRLGTDRFHEAWHVNLSCYGYCTAKNTNVDFVALRDKVGVAFISADGDLGRG